MAEVKPLYAIHHITYGKAQIAPSDSVFTPIHEDERQELLDLGAARELEEHEAALFTVQNVAEPEAPAPVKRGAKKADEPEADLG